MSAAVPARPEHVAVAIVGAGQAGLSLAWHLRGAGMDHVVLERRSPGHAWRDERWDSFCLVTPNWQCQLPGFPYAGDDPNGFMVRDEIVAYLDGFRRSFNPPIREGVEVLGLSSQPGGGFMLRTAGAQGPGALHAEQVVVATGGYHDPIIPPYAGSIDPAIAQIHSSTYRNPDALPPGPVFVVGTGQSGAQIAEDLHLGGRRVHLAVGAAPRVSRSYRGRDLVEWLHRMGYYDLPVDRHPLREGVRDRTNHYVTGRDGGRDIDLRRFALEGMRLYGSLAGIDRDGVARFEPNLGRHLDAADETNAGIKRSVDDFITRERIEAPVEPPYAPPWRPETDPLALDLRAEGVASVVWCLGFRADYRWIELPVFDGRGRPVHHRGVTSVAGLYFLGLPWLHTWGSGRFSGIARDAEHILAAIERQRSDPAIPGGQARGVSSTGEEKERVRLFHDANTGG